MHYSIKCSFNSFIHSLLQQSTVKYFFNSRKSWIWVLQPDIITNFAIITIITMQSSRTLVSRLLQQSVRRYHGDGHGHFKPPTMDELPVPRGSWQTQYDAKQKKYNAVLAFGIAFTAFTAVVAKSSGLIYLNYYPPQSLD